MQIGDLVVCMYDGTIGVVIEDKNNDGLYRISFPAGEVDFWRDGGMLEVISEDR